jgi:hypothetical protein
MKDATVARQPCYRTQRFTGFRPVALRPTLSSGLPLSSFLCGNENLLLYFQQIECQNNFLKNLF